MAKTLRADGRKLRLRSPHEGTVDIFFDEHRVWSTPLPEPDKRDVRVIRWPKALLPYLNGTTQLTVRSSATSEELATVEVAFGGGGDAEGRAEIIDASGRWLAMNKWNRLGPVFEGDSTGIQGRLLASASHVAEQVAELGFPIYIVGGTLLGAMRSGALLPHDDDIDFAFWCDKSDVQDVALVSFELQRALERLDYLVVRHSHAHLELVFLTDEGATDYYIDIFTGYHSVDGLYNQPFALRGTLPKDTLVPTRMVEVSGVPLPAPGVPQAWLEYAYGPSWLVPDPSFKFVTPRAVLRRFENTFGVFNRQRVFWEKSWQKVDKRLPAAPADLADTERFLRLLPPGAFVIDLGCGAGEHAEVMAAAGHEVLGVDYSFEALRVARQTQPPGVDYQFLNLNDRHSLIGFALDLVTSGRRPYFYARNLLHELSGLGRVDVLQMMRNVLDADTFLYATWDASPVARVPANPETWHLTMPTLRREAWRFGLGTTVIHDRRRPTRYGDRTNLTALLWK